MWQKIIALFFFLVANSAFASCPGMTGDVLARCECMELGSIYPRPEELTCSKNSDCITIEGNCGGWVAINRTNAEDFKARNAEILQRGADLKKSRRFEAICGEKRWCEPNWRDYGAPR